MRLTLIEKSCRQEVSLNEEVALLYGTVNCACVWILCIAWGGWV